MSVVLVTKFQSISDSVNFKVKRKEEIAAESMRMNQEEVLFLVLLPTAYGKILILRVQIANRDTKQHEAVFPFTSIIEDQTAKERLYEIECVSLTVFLKKISDNFPEKFKLPKFILPVKISWLNFVYGFRGRNEKFAKIRAGSLSGLAASVRRSISRSHVPNAR